MTKPVAKLFGLAFVLLSLAACEHTQGDAWWMGSDKVPKADAVRGVELPPVAAPQKLAPPVQQPPVATPQLLKKEPSVVKAKTKSSKPVVKAKKKAKPVAAKSKAVKKSPPKKTLPKKAQTAPVQPKAEDKKLVLIEPTAPPQPKTDPAASKEEIEALSQKLKKPRVKSGEKETWCYRTIAKPDCYNAPLPGEAERLIAVDPPSKMPRSAAEYQERVNESH